MLPLRVIDTEDSKRFAHLKHKTAIEQGRANALDLLIAGRPLEEVALQLIASIEESATGYRCALMAVNEDGRTLSPLIAPSLPASFIAGLREVMIGEDVGCCGAAVYHKRPFVASDVMQHPNWRAFQQLALENGIRSCWSFPVILPDGSVYGSISVYNDEVHEPDQDDMAMLEYEAKIISIIVERARHIQQLKDANSQLEVHVAERTKELTEANLLLRKALEQRNDVRNQLIEMENMAALGTMMSSLTHEINTPVGVAITAVTHLSTLLQQSSEALQAGELKRSSLERTFNESAEATEIIERNLERATQLIKTFKQLSIDQHSQDARPINLCAYIDEVLLSLKPRLKRAKHKFCIDVNPDLEFIGNPGAISQLLINLIINSAMHAFDEQQSGQITLRANEHQDNNQRYVTLHYVDNGRGMSANTIENLYKPFFTLARNKGGSGLGMHICYNIAVKVLRGSIDCESSPGKGVHFTIQFPVEKLPAS